MDTLKVRVIKRSQIPAPKQRIQGRLGEFWTKLQLLGADEVLKVENRFGVWHKRTVR
jgi:hypothetical protein